VAILGLSLLVLLYASSRDPFFRKQEFHSQEWQSGNMRKRGQMVSSLVEKRILAGKKQSDVLALLGEPSTASTNRIAYKIDIGYRFGFSPWLYVLAIDFNETNGIVSSVTLKD
jgi:hypothetical protein